MHRLTLAHLVLMGSLIAGHGVALAEDDDVKVLLENAQVRVTEMRFKPGAKIESLAHRNRFVYALTDGALVFKPPGRTPYELSFKAGEALWLPTQATGTENDTNREVRALVVDLKEIVRPGRSRPKSKKPEKPAASAKSEATSAAKPAKSKSGS